MHAEWLPLCKFYQNWYGVSWNILVTHTHACMHAHVHACTHTQASKNIISHLHWAISIFLFRGVSFSLKPQFLLNSNIPTNSMTFFHAHQFFALHSPPLPAHHTLTSPPTHHSGRVFSCRWGTKCGLIRRQRFFVFQPLQNVKNVWLLAEYWGGWSGWGC